MKKIVSSTDLGGAPIFKNDLREVFNQEIWKAMQALLSQYDSDVEGIIVSGCVITANAGNFDMTAGVVYLDGEFMDVSGVVNATFTKYIEAFIPTEDSRTFADGSVHGVVRTANAQIVSGVPIAQRITISSLTSVDARRWSQIIEGRDKLWLSNVPATTDIVKEDGVTHPTSRDGNSYIKYKRNSQETFVKIWVSCIFAVTPTVIGLSVLPAPLVAVLNADGSGSIYPGASFDGTNYYPGVFRWTGSFLFFSPDTGSSFAGTNNAISLSLVIPH